MRPLKDWFTRTFDDPQLLLLALGLLIFFVGLSFFAHIIAPVIAAMVIAFVLDGPNEALRRRGLPAWGAATITFLGFLVFVGLIFLMVLPPLARQIAAFATQAPQMLDSMRDEISMLANAYPDFITQERIDTILADINSAISHSGGDLLLITIGSLETLVVGVVYTLLILVTTFFFLKDKRQILSWFAGFLPPHRPLADQVWHEATARAGDYGRGKVYEIIIVGIAAWGTFMLVSLPYSLLLAVLTGFSVLIPFIGAAAVTVPVVLIAFFEWGFGTETLIAISAYLILQAIDGNILVPLLFSEVVKLHPFAVVMAILVFGGFWGLWGVFFAVPLATLGQAVIKAWRQGSNAVHAPSDA